MPTNFRQNFEDWDNDDALPEADGADALWDLLSLYADGETTPAETAEVEALLRDNPTYLRELSFLRMTADAAHLVEEIEPPATLRDAIFAKTTRRPTWKSRLTAAWSDLRLALSPAGNRFVLPTAGAAAVLIAASLLWSRSSSVSTPIASEKPVPPLASTGSKPLSATNLTKQSVAVSKKPAPPKRVVMPPAPDFETPAEPVQLADNRLRSQEEGSKRAQLDVGVRLAQISAAAKKHRLESRLQMPAPVERAAPVIAANAYSVDPQMDQINQRPMLLSKKETTPEFPASPSETDVESTPSAPVAAAKSAEPTAASLRATRINRTRLTAAQLPPDLRRALSGADFKRLKNAEQPNSDWDTALSAYRQQSPTLVVGRF